MNRKEKIEFLNDVKKGNKSVKELVEKSHLEYDYEAMTCEQLEKVIELFPIYDELAPQPQEEEMTQEQIDFLNSLPRLLVSSIGERKIPSFDHLPIEDIERLLSQLKKNEQTEKNSIG